jgi:response regulator RpfG family c-di-GMP phosphodiesterase
MNEEQPLPTDELIPAEEPLYVLCVDDDEDILRTLARSFRNEPFRLLTATSGQEALALIESTENIGLIISDQRMPGMNGWEFLELAKKQSPDSVRMILTGYSDIADAIDAINKGGAKWSLTKPWEDATLLHTVREGLMQYRSVREQQRNHEQVSRQNELLEEWNSNLKRRVIQQTALIRNKLEEANRQKVSVQQSGDALVFMFIDMMERRHHQLCEHSRNVAALTASMTATLQLPPAECEAIKTAALIHDIGLFCASDTVLDGGDHLKSTGEYWSHPIRGEEILAVSEQLRGIGTIIRHHHEEFDGSGFPDGLSGENIPLGSRIINLASFIDNNYSADDGSNAEYNVNCKIGAGIGTHFDPALGAAAFRAVREVLVERYQ